MTPSTAAYLICATPRTGSSLLCGLLESTWIGGRPESYFRQPDEQSWADQWKISRSSDGSFAYADFVRAAIAAGRTENGVFATRIMWGTLEKLIDKLGNVYPDLAGADRDLLHRAFGPTHFVYLRREDVVAQAVSWLRAEQTDVWYETDQFQHGQPEQDPDFDPDKIDELIQVIDEHNAAWERWFASVGVSPHLVRYEDLAADPVAVTLGVLDSLGLQLPPGHEIRVRHRRLADDLNTQWIARYRDTMGDR